VFFGQCYTLQGHSNEGTGRRSRSFLLIKRHSICTIVFQHSKKYFFSHSLIPKGQCPDVIAGLIYKANPIVFVLLPTIRLSSYLPEAFVKGRQPTYLEEPGEEEFAYVVSTLAVQVLQINARDCRFTPKSFYDGVGKQRQLRDGDIVLTMDGGTSIGKAAVFDLTAFSEAVEVDSDEVFVTVDSHVAVLRPQGISSLALAYLLASPIGQAQFQRAESGASGQTAVTEDDVRYFQLPQFDPAQLEAAVFCRNTADTGLLPSSHLINGGGKVISSYFIVAIHFTKSNGL
jgi:hypothetical protein